MTENEAIEYMENEVRCIKQASHCDRDCLKCGLVKEEQPLLESFAVAIQALEEIQQYRAIGTVEDIYNMLEVLNRTISELHSEVDKYRAIGTIEEFKALKEKNTPKKRGIWKSGHTLSKL